MGGGSASDVANYLNDGSAVEGWWKPVTESSAESPVLSNLYNPDGSVDPAQANKLAFLEQWDPENPASYNPDADQTQRWWVERHQGGHHRSVQQSEGECVSYFAARG